VPADKSLREAFCEIDDVNGRINQTAFEMVAAGDLVNHRQGAAQPKCRSLGCQSTNDN
jgi:hypothetical protein